MLTVKEPYYLPVDLPIDFSNFDSRLEIGREDEIAVGPMNFQSQRNF